MMLCSGTVLAERGTASWYGPHFHGKLMANGKIYNMHGNSCAHKTLPLGKRVLITNHDNGKSVWSTVTDRGPYIAGRILDMSLGLKNKIGCNGLCNVSIR